MTASQKLPPSDAEVGGVDTEELEGAGDDAVIGRAFRWSLAAILLLAVVVVGAVIYANRPQETPSVQTTEYVAPKTREFESLTIPEMRFTDITSAAGLNFRHANGARGEKLLPETMGSGCAFFDFDQDGDQDILLVNSCEWPWNQTAGPQPTLALYRNEGEGQFSDATAACGLDVTCYGMGAAVGDYDNDGWVDLFVTAVGANRLFHNEQGRFRDVTEAAGVAGGADEWSTGAGFFDYDNDGDLDLLAVNYIRWSREIDSAQGFSLVGVGRAYGPPLAFQGTFPYLYRNDGEGRFTDVSQEAGLHVTNPSTGVPVAKSLGVAPIDLDSDGWLDFVIANDTVQNFVFHNQKNGTFQEIGALSGIAFDSNGNARGAMGIDTADYRNDGSLAVAIGNFANEMTALYVSQDDPLQFVDAAIATGLGPQTRLELKFGVFFFDCDLDGRLDLLQANGHLEEEINQVQVTQHYAQPPQLFWNCGPGHGAAFAKVPPENCGEDFARPMVGRGAAYADIDGDGDLDVLLTASGGSPRLLRNEHALGHHWIRFHLQGTRANRDAIGAWVEVHLEVQGQPVVQRRQVMPTRSYLSQVELPVTFGLGEAREVLKAVIRWPDGSVQELAAPAPDQVHRVEQAPPAPQAGAAPAPSPLPAAASPNAP